MRRPVALPAPWTAFVAARLGVFALALPPVAVAFAFIGWVSDKGLIAALGGAALVALAALAFAALAFLRIWQSGSQGLGSVISGSLAAGLVLAIPLLAGILFLMIPAVPDLSTDLRSPARFDALADDPAPLRLDEDGAGYDQRIMMLDGNFRTLFIDRPAWHVHEVLTGFAEEQGWQIVSNRAPAGRSAGRIEFIIPSWVPLMQRRGIIRLIDDGEETAIDLRIAMRTLPHDFGKVPEDMRMILDAILTAIAATPRPQSDL